MWRRVPTGRAGWWMDAARPGGRPWLRPARPTGSSDRARAVRRLACSSCPRRSAGAPSRAGTAPRAVGDHRRGQCSSGRPPGRLPGRAGSAPQGESACRCASADRLEVQDRVEDVGGVGNGVVVLVRRRGPAGVVLGAVLVPGRAVQQRDDRRLRREDLLQGVERGLLRGRVVAAGELGQRGLRLRAAEPAEVTRGGLADRALSACCRSSSGSSSTGWVPGYSSGSWRRSCRPGSRRTTGSPRRP